MRKSYSLYSLLTLSSVFLVGNCSIIAEVDRTKIPQDGGTEPEGGQGQGGSARGGSSGTSGTGGNAGAGEGGMGGEAGGDTGGTSGTAGDAGAGMGGTDMGGAGMGGAGDGGGGGMPAECGNNQVEMDEECDDGDMMAGDGCNATCAVEDGWECIDDPSVCSTVCGDGIETGTEACDDGNTLPCGTCNAACSMDQASAAATGTITPAAPADLVDDQDFFTLNDGTGPTEFEFDATPGDGVGTNRVPIVFDPAGDATALQGAIVAAINGVTGFGITAIASGAANVTVTNESPGTAGNQTSGETVTAAAFMITDMTGGVAHDCTAGQGCAGASDCASGTCSTTTDTCM